MLFFVEQPNFVFNHFVINEPVSVLTDILLAVVALFFFIRIRHIANSNYVKSWNLFFLFMGISTFFAGIVHGLKSFIGEDYHIFFLVVMQLLATVPGYFAGKANLLLANKLQYFKLYNFFFLMSITSSLILKEFIIVKLVSSFIILIIILCQIYFSKLYKYSTNYILLGLFLGLITVLIHSLKLSASIWFNYKDISHVIMAVSLVFVGIGVIRFNNIYLLKQDTID